MFALKTAVNQPLIFVSYRRDDSADVTGRIYDKLCQHFPPGAIFKDVDSIPAGVDFRVHLDQAVRQCKVVLVVIGKTWLAARNEAGQCRLDNPADFVRLEVESALQHAYRVIPVLVQNTRMPAAAELPESLRPLAYRNCCLVRPDPDFHRDAERLAQVLRQSVSDAQAAPAGTPAPPAPSPRVRGVKVISHSGFFYWWPVWAVAFFLAALTAFGPNRLALLPAGTKVAPGIQPGEFVLTVPDKQSAVLERAVDRARNGEESFPTRALAPENKGGVIFLFVLLLVIVITNLSLSGVWSLAVVLGVCVLSVVAALTQTWESVFRATAVLDAQISLENYLFLGVTLFVLWLLSVLVIDPRRYLIVTPDQVRVKEDPGSPEQVYDTTGLVVARKREDVFRHWILGQGSGDLVVRTGGATPREFVLPNVLFVGAKLKLIEELLGDKPVAIGA
jgi:hypothetical protein